MWGVSGGGVNPRLDRVHLDGEVVGQKPAEVVGTDVVSWVDALRLHVLVVVVVEVVVDREQQPAGAHRVDQR